MHIPVSSNSAKVCFSKPKKKNSPTLKAAIYWYKRENSINSTGQAVQPKVSKAEVATVRQTQENKRTNKQTAIAWSHWNFHWWYWTVCWQLRALCALIISIKRNSLPNPLRDWPNKQATNYHQHSTGFLLLLPPSQLKLYQKYFVFVYNYYFYSFFLFLSYCCQSALK